MPRAIWSGAVSFGLVSIPVKLYNAVSRKSVHFNQLDSRTGARIRYKKVSDADGEEVPSEAIVKGYALSSGEYVLLGDDELGALDPEASRTVEIEQFVDLDEIDPIFYDAAYYAAPDKAARKPYALLVKAMEEQGRVAIARFVMRSKQYLSVLRADDGLLVLSTMVYADEVNDPAELTELDGVDDVEVSDRELRMARQLVDSLTEEFDPGKFEDTYRMRVLDLIERKAAGEELVAPAAPAAEEKLVDLMAALEESVREAKESRKRHPTAQDAEEAEAEREKAPAKTAKRRSA
ncbi:MAG TPA: Ku protein [Acidimicrobiales bacterium]|jgi:DNA end-binding protein Ku|nr:Ku protein [Acidimicrobiales bacterium]